MGKILKPLAIIAAVAVNVIPGVGQVLSAALVTAITSAGITAALGYAASALGLGPKSPDVSPANRDRLFANVDPATPRKLIFGRTAMATDIRYQEWAGNDQEYLHQIVCVASHKVSSIDQVWLDDELAWSNGAAVGKYAEYLTITRVLEGGPGNTVVIGNGAKWGASRRMTGLAYLHMRFKVTGNSKKKESPFAQKIPSRMTVIGNGMPVYDPRFDSTNGGSGPMRPDDESTWAFSYGGVECGRNPANQLLTYLLGWRIANPATGVKKLAVGRGIPANRFDFAKWITAANACDEAVALAGGGSEPRYRSDGIFSESDDPRQVIEAYETTMNAKLRDTGGRFGVVVLSNDLAAPRLALDDSDVLGEFRWNPKGSIERNFNEIRGRFTDPRTVSLYQLVDYPRWRETPLDGIERVLPFDLPLVQSPSQAQRLVKQQAARLKYQGKFEANLGPRGWALQLGDVVTLTFSSLGWGAKLFRVVEHGIKPDGVCPVVLQEEHADIYLWDRDERPPVQPVELVQYDPAQSVLLQLLVAGEIDYSDGTPIEDLQPSTPGATAGATLGSDFKSPGGVIYTQAEIETILGTAGTLFNQGKGAIANNLSDLDSTAAARLTDAMRAAAGGLPAQFDVKSYTPFASGGLLSTFSSLEEAPVSGYTVDAGGRSVVIGPGRQTISPLVDLPLLDGVIYEFRFEAEVLSAAGGTSARAFFSFLDSAFVLQTNLSAGWQQNLSAGQRASIRVRVGKNVPPSLVDINVTGAALAFLRPSLEINLNATDFGNHPSAVTRFFGVSGTVDFFAQAPITRLTEDGTTAVTLDNFKTPLGTANAVFEQGTGATANSLAELNAGEGAKLTGIEAGADVTATAQRSILPQFPVIEIKQGEAGHTGDRTVTHTALRGLFGISGGTWTLPSQNLGAGSASINASTGTVTLAGIVQSGAYAVRYTHTDGIGIELEVNVTFVPLVAAGVGSTASSAVRGFSTSTFAVVSEVMTISLPAGVTSAILQASDINLELALATPFGVTDAELKWQRETSPGVWGDVGAVATSSPSPEVADEGGLPAAIFGFITCNRVATGLTAGSTQKFRLSARVSGGNVRAVSSFGVVTAAA